MQPRAAAAAAAFKPLCTPLHLGPFMFLGPPVPVQFVFSLSAAAAPSGPPQLRAAAAAFRSLYIASIWDWKCFCSWGRLSFMLGVMRSLSMLQQGSVWGWREEGRGAVTTCAVEWVDGRVSGL